MLPVLFQVVICCQKYFILQDILIAQDVRLAGFELINHFLSEKLQKSCIIDKI